MTHQTPVPGTQAPAIDARNLQGEAFDVFAQTPKNFAVVFFYRGVHCPICKKQLEELNDSVDRFGDLGVAVHAVSMDDKARFDRQTEGWDIDNLSLAYGLSEDSARAWGLFLSQQEKDAEPARFAEPGIAVLYPDGRIYAMYLQNVPFARPRLDDLLNGLAFIIKNDYPVRGTLQAA